MKRVETSSNIWQGFISIDARLAYRLVQSGDSFKWVDHEGRELNGMHTVKGDHFIYTGEFKDGKPHGYGIMNTDGNSYEGNFNQGTMEGRGVFTYESGVIHEGIFSGNMLNGIGEIRDPKRCIVFKGFFVDNLLHDSAGEKEDYRRGIRTVGSFVFGKEEGSMKVYDTAGAIHALVFKDGSCIDPKWRKNSFGLICIMGGEDQELDSTMLGDEVKRGTTIHSSGVTCRGEVENGMMNGKGMMSQVGADLFYQGSFHDGIMYGTVKTLLKRDFSQICFQAYLGLPYRGGIPVRYNQDLR